MSDQHWRRSGCSYGDISRKCTHTHILYTHYDDTMLDSFSFKSLKLEGTTIKTIKRSH